MQAKGGYVFMGSGPNLGSQKGFGVFMAKYVYNQKNEFHFGSLIT